jgi:hypothetical protein
MRPEEWGEGGMRHQGVACGIGLEKSMGQFSSTSSAQDRLLLRLQGVLIASRLFKGTSGRSWRAAGNLKSLMVLADRDGPEYPEDKEYSEVTEYSDVKE